MAKQRTEVADIDRSLYDFSYGDSTEKLEAGLTPEIVREISEKKDEPEPLVLSRAEVKHLFAGSGVEAEKMEEIEERYEESSGANTEFLASNVMNTRKFEIKAPDVVIQVNPERTDLVETRIIDGRQCLVIPVDDRVEVNGISVRTMRSSCGGQISEGEE